MEPSYRFRLFLLTGMVLLGCGVLLSRLHEFQIEQREKYVANVPTSHNVTVREPGVRGEIQDRNGTVLALNRRSYEVVFNLQDIYQSYVEQRKDDPKLQVEETFRGADGMPRLRKKTDIVRIVNDWVIPRLEAHGLGGKRFTNALKVHFDTHGGFVPFPYRTDLSYDEFAQLAERSLDFPGVKVTVVPRREYPYGTTACHLLGQVKQWEKGDIPREFRGRSRMHYQGEDKGIAGVEYSMDEHLRGKGGRQVYVRNEKNQIIAVEDYQPPEQGSTVELTIDARMQYLVETIMRRVGRGAAVVLDPSTGEVIAMASVPNFDPNHFVPSISSKQWNAYNTNKANPFLNRAINSYTPGSTFKLPTAIAGCIHGQTAYRHNCVGATTYGSLRIRCWKTTGHGSLKLAPALQRSCNPYFMSLANQIGNEAMVETFDLLGFGRKTGIELPNEDPGIVPGSDIWKREIKPGARLTPAAAGMFSIGQSDSMASPLQIAAATAAIANGGRYYQPRLVRRIITADGEVVRDNVPIVKVNLLNHGMTPQSIEVIRKGMWMAVNQAGGTAGRASLDKIQVAAKTGTAQTGQPDSGDKNNAWTAAFAPFDTPRFAVCVMVRNGRSGGKVAGTLTHLILRGLFAIDYGFQPRLTKTGLFPGHFDAIEEVPLPKDGYMTLTLEDTEETGDILDAALVRQGVPVKVTPRKVLLPSISPREDDTQ